MDGETKNLKVVDFFCGAGGMSYGLHLAGLKILGGIDNSSDCRDTYEYNIPDALYIERDIAKLTCNELKKILNIAPLDPNLVFAGCSPCQFWSKISTIKTKSKETAYLLEYFQKFIEFFQPGYVIVENVPGMHSRKHESILSEFHDFLDNYKYSWADEVINANYYGVPQNRKRYLLIASNVQQKVSIPVQDSERPIVKDFIGTNNGFEAIQAGQRDESLFLHTAASLSLKNLQRIKLTPKSGGSRISWKDNDELQIPTYRGRDNIFRDVYGRMSWDRPAPTITTRFNSLSNGRFGHPDEDRAISIREGATLQTFPKDYIFFGSNMNCITKQIGNAVPPELAHRIGKHLKGGSK